MLDLVFFLDQKLEQLLSGRLVEGNNRLSPQTMLLPILLALELRCSWRGFGSHKLPVVQACLSGVRS